MLNFYQLIMSKCKQNNTKKKKNVAAGEPGWWGDGDEVLLLAARNGRPMVAGSAAGPNPSGPAAPSPRPTPPRGRRRRASAVRSERRGGDAPRDRDAGARRDGRQDKGPRGARPHGHDKDRDRFSRKPAQSLYSVESVVDRGFEEAPDAADFNNMLNEERQETFFFRKKKNATNCYDHILAVQRP